MFAKSELDQPTGFLFREEAPRWQANVAGMDALRERSGEINRRAAA
jgi:hypothetical protein